MSDVIYKIINLTNGNFYVGSTSNHEVRFRTHRRQLNNHTHHNFILQKAWDKHGENEFLFRVVEEVPENTDKLEHEDKWLKEHCGKRHCYNLAIDAQEPPHPSGESHPLHGKRHSPETRAKISAAVRKADSEGRGKRHHEVTAETRAKMSIALKGNECAKGHVRTATHRQHLSEANMGNQNWLNKHHSDESRAKMGKGLVEVTTGKTFVVMNDAVKFYGMANLATILRSIKTGRAVRQGPNKGLRFAYKH